MLNSHLIRDALDTGALIVQPLNDGQIQPASIDLTLGRQLLQPHAGLREVDPRRDMTKDVVRTWIPTGDKDYYLMKPQEFLLATTEEFVRIAPSMVGRLEGRSSVGRLGLFVHVTAGFIDPGFEGEITLELYNASGLPMRLYAGMPIGQLSLVPLTLPDPVDAQGRINTFDAYTGKYQRQMGPTPSRLHHNWDVTTWTWR